MVHKKYIKRGKKIFGPYFYENYRDSAGETKTRYLGTKDPEKIKKKKSFFNKKFSSNYFNFTNLFIVLGVVGIISILILLSFFFRGLTGRATFEVAPSYSIGEQISGNLILNLKQGELIPVDSIVVVKIGSQEKQISLSELVSDLSANGNYYVENLQIQGSGNGFGVEGEKKIYPKIFFDLIINKKAQTETPTEETPAEEQTTPIKEIPTEESPVETPTIPEEQTTPAITEEQTPAETPTTPTESAIRPDSASSETSLTKSSESSGESSETSLGESPSESTLSGSSGSETEPTPITGGVISENSQIVSGSVSADEPFSYSLVEDESAEIEPESVKTDSKELSKNDIDLKIKNNQAIVTTDYFEFEKGFGKEYIGDKNIRLNLDLSKFGITAEEGQILVYLSYNDAEIVFVSKKISVVQQIENETIEENASEIEENITVVPELNFTEQNITVVNETIINITEQNITIINETITNITIANETITNVSIGNLSIETIQYGAVVGKPVKWKKTITSDVPTNVSVEIPKSAENISVYKIEGREKTEIEEENTGEEVSPTPQVSSNPQTVSPNSSIDNSSSSINNNSSDIQSSNEITESSQSASETSVNNGVEEKRTEVSDENVSIITSTISGQVSAEIELDKGKGFNIFKFFRNLFSRITGRSVVTEETLEKKEVIITENASEYEIEYETPAPISYEKETLNGKMITISGPDELNYTNVLAFSDLPYELSMSDAYKIRLYWVRESVNVNESNVISQESIINETNSTGLITFGVNINGLKNKEKDAIDVASMITHILTDVNIDNDIKYINVSIDNYNAEDAPVASMVMHQSNKLGLDGLPGSIPGWSASALSQQILPLVSAQETAQDIQYKRIPVQFTAIDADNDSLIDYIEWNVLHLSNQTYQLIIEISSAEHLNENRTFIEDIYNSVKAQDGNWSPVINNSHYVRVTFKQNLTSERDITVYARTLNKSVIIDGKEVPYDVYLKKKRIDEIRKEMA